jgi:uncharacterized protein (TIGR02246 family)
MTTQTSAPAASESKGALIGAVMMEVAKVPDRLVSAWAAHDAEAFSQLFAPDGTMILPGVYKKGREEIRQYMEAGYANQYKGTSVKGKPLDIKPLGSDAVALLTEGGVMAPGETEYSSKEAIRASWILIKSEGAWRLAVYHNCPRDPAS